MQRILILILSVFLAALTIPAQARCGTCDEDAPAEKQSKEKTCPQAKKCPAKSKDKGSLEDRVSCLEECLKDASSGPAGKPFTSKGQGSKAQVTSYTEKGSK
jgi:hypothetical protein